ncbi:MAG: LysR family transcriptional regulator [Candidatus Promineifilaceae bacterium]
MEIKQLEGLIAIAREGNFTRAAERLNLSQPSLSARIQQLEQSLGGEILVDRRARPVTLTPAGEALLAYAERALGILEAGQQAVKTASEETVGRLVVTTPFSIATYLLPGVVNYFSRAYPRVELHIEAGNSEFAVGRLLDGLADLAFTAAFPQYLRQTTTIHRFHDEMGLAVSTGHPLTTNPRVPVNEVWNYRLLLIHWGKAFESYVTSLRQMHPDPGLVISVPLAVALPMLRKSDTVAFMPKRLIAAAGLVEVDVPEIAFDWDVVLVTRPGRLLAPLESEFVNIVIDRWQQQS